MDLQKDFLNMQIAYEKNCAIRCNCSYEGLKAQLDRSESLFGTRYLEGSPRHENWLLWVEAWQAAKAQAVPEWISVNDKLPPANILVLGMSQTRSNIFNIYNVMALDEFEEADVTHWTPLPDAPQEPAND